MATILDFRAVTAKRAGGPIASDALAAQGGSAELIFFPGVRYERVAEPAVRKRRAKSRGRAHDQIELPD